MIAELSHFALFVALIASCCQAICLFMAVLQKGHRASLADGFS